jgi:hypothetical protein
VVAAGAEEVLSLSQGNKTVTDVKSQNSRKKQPRRRHRALTNYFAPVERVRAPYALAIFMAIVRHPGVSIKQLADLVGCDKATAYRVADKLVATGAIVTRYHGRERCFEPAPAYSRPPPELGISDHGEREP